MKGQNENKPPDCGIERESKARLVPPLPPLANLAVQIGFDLAAINEVPTDPEKLSTTLVGLASLVTNDILCLFESRLTADDRALFRLGETESRQRWTDLRRERVWGIFDQMVIEKAQTLGWRIYLSPRVLNRMAEWHHSGDRGIRRLRQLGEAVTRASRVAQGKDRLPITEPEWREFKRAGVSELRRLGKQYRAIFNQRRTTTAYPEACKWLRNTIDNPNGAFPLLRSNANSLFVYLELAAKEDMSLQNRIILGKWTPGSLFDEWVAFTRNVSPVTFRQSVSKLPLPKG